MSVKGKDKENTGRSYGYNDPNLVGKLSEKDTMRWSYKKTFALALAILFITGVWLALNQKLLFGKDWLSETYDNPDWRTNEGNLHTYGAWDLETHVWKTEYIMQYFPNYTWNPYWYLGMPLMKYYQSGFYIANILAVLITGLSAARSALLLVIFGHLLATFLTFLVCYKVSRKIWLSALAASFLLSNTFLSLRSYGWEPITVVFLFLYPLGLYLFLKEPLRPFRFWLILTLGIAYLCHPLLWFSLCMFMGLYLLSIAVRQAEISDGTSQQGHYIWQYIAVVFCSILLGALQFLPQITYNQVTSGAHMGMQYLPFYQVPPNIISLKDFFFDAGNLKGPGPIIMIAFFLLIIFAYVQYIQYARKAKGLAAKAGTGYIGEEQQMPQKRLHEHELISGVTLVLAMMVLFYYLELYNIFPMNFLRSIQYHRIIPEFVITAAVLVAALSNMTYTYKQKVMYYSMLISFVAATGIIIYLIQAHWETTDQISTKPEFIYDKVAGRVSMPYTDQSFAVRNSFTAIPQAYGYYEQGITNPYADEIFSVSSGYQNANLTKIYLQAANVGRLYVNLEEGERDQIVMARLNGTLPFIRTNNTRYAYFQIPLKDPSFSQAVDEGQAKAVQKLEPGCRVLFQDTYCGSVREEFVGTDPASANYIAAYDSLLEQPYSPKAIMVMDDPNHYTISVKNATSNTSIVVKMTHDQDFSATVFNEKVGITSIGPDFMLISPHKSGQYTIKLSYGVGTTFLAGLAVSALSFVVLSIYFALQNLPDGSGSASSKKESKNIPLPGQPGYTIQSGSREKQFHLYFEKGDMK